MKKSTTMKKSISMMLVLTLLFISLPCNTAFASAFRNGQFVVGDDSLDNMVLVSSEIVTVQDDKGNDINIVVEEYMEVPKDNVIRPFGLDQEHPIGYKKTWSFKITNEQLQLVGYTVSAPISDAAKKSLANLIAKVIGETIASAIKPAVGWVAWLLTGAGIANAVYGNKGFTVSISGVYTETYLHKEGYYLYGWNLSLPSIATY